MKKDSIKYISKAGIKFRPYWTDTAIIKFLGTHDKEAVNPHYKKAAPMKLYILIRVEEIEETFEFQEFIKKRITKSDSYIRASETREKNKKDKILQQTEYCKQEIADFLSKFKESLPNLSEFELTGLACSHYNDWQNFKIDYYNNYFDFIPADYNSDKSFLNRISLNFIRHQYTEYDKTLRFLDFEDGFIWYLELKTKVNEAILDKYEWLKNED